ncbi:unnamed protein product [Strongylus vulgaris]|uniref:Uncharacterized protein n=1 Tax=Strongylus vulgaris TaxID=40348 RepID=A0A3P7IN61_STRVU|nr:unnamed protein product [Strongylus vulgaris]
MVLAAFGVAALCCLLAVVIIVATIIQKKKKKKREEAEKSKKVLLAKKPRKMESANINATKFTHGGALVLDAKLRGPVVRSSRDVAQLFLFYRAVGKV